MVSIRLSAEQRVGSPSIRETRNDRASQTEIYAFDLIGGVFHLTTTEVGCLSSASPFISFFFFFAAVR